MLETLEKPYDLNFVEAFAAEEAADVAELLDSRGWQALIRCMSTEIRKYEQVLQDPLLETPKRLALLDRWAVARDLYKVLKHAPEHAKAGLRGQAQASEESDFKPSPRMPIGPLKTPNNGLTRIK